MAGCKDCKHYNRTIGEFKDNKFHPVRTCKLDKVEAMNKWWADNGNKVATETLDDMSCHEYTDLDKKLNTSLANVEKILERMNTHAQEWLEGKTKDK